MQRHAHDVRLELSHRQTGDCPAWQSGATARQRVPPSGSGSPEAEGASASPRSNAAKTVRARLSIPARRSCAQRHSLVGAVRANYASGVQAALMGGSTVTASSAISTRHFRSTPSYSRNTSISSCPTAFSANTIPSTAEKLASSISR